MSKGLPSAEARFPPVPYLRGLTQWLWHERMLAVPKSRQMMVTWLVAAYILGESYVQPGRLHLWQSKKEIDSIAVLERITGMDDRLREFAPWYPPGRRSASTTELAFANGSKIVAAPQGAHHVQSHTPTSVVLDEVQLQDEAEAAFYQALPACERITLIGSAEYSWFWNQFLSERDRDEPDAGHANGYEQTVPDRAGRERSPGGSG